MSSDVCAALCAAGYVVDVATDGEDAWFRGDTEDYGAIILDLGLPRMDGLSVLKRWRANGRAMPVLILTARGSWAERVDGIDAGADDYLPKPFRMEELLARLRAIVRRSVGQASAILTAGEVTLDDRQKLVTVRGVPLSLSPLEYRLVAYLIKHRGKVVGQGELEENVYGHDEPHNFQCVGSFGRPRPPQTRNSAHRDPARVRLPRPGVVAMRWNSLRLRLLAGGLAAMALALAIAGAGLTALFERHVMRTIADELDVHLRQLLSGIDVDTADRLVVNRPPVDPRFAEPMSGLYWQVGNEPGQLLRSRSLWDTTLALPADNLAPGEAHLHPAKGPNNASVLVLERKISLTVGGSRQNVRVAVAGNLDRVSRASSAFARELSAALGLLALTLGIATAVQVTLGLRPLGALQRGVADIRSGSASQLSSAVPSEVQPLVDELNGLLREQDGEVERSRGRAADLAHGLKTPLVALAADVTRLRALGQGGIAHDIEQIGDAMNRHVDRELARARVRGKSRTSTPYSTELLPLVRSLMATIERTPAGAPSQA